MPLTASNLQIYQVYGELDNILGSSGLISRLHQALVDRLSAMRGMLLEAFLSSTEADGYGHLLATELAHNTSPEPASLDDRSRSLETTGVHC